MLGMGPGRTRPEPETVNSLMGGGPGTLRLTDSDKTVGISLS